MFEEVKPAKVDKQPVQVVKQDEEEVIEEIDTDVHF